ncbi:MAG: site-specific integrase [Clostridium sp.]|jgi:integrase|nr:site-specific integrase [Clostridium sp.]
MPRLYRSYFTYNGKKYERTSTKSQRDADRKADKYLHDLEDGIIGISKQMRVTAWANEWLETYKKPSLTEKSYKNHKRFVDNVIVPQIGGLRLCEVTDVHLQKLLNGRAGKSYSDLKHLRDTIKAIFKKARESKLLIYDPAEFLIIPRSTKGERRSITDFEREHFLKVAETHYAGSMFKIMLYCGLRPGEVMALSWKDIDFDNHMLNIVSAVESGTTTLKAPKTEAGVRKIPVPDEIFNDLLLSRGDPFDPVFTQMTTGRRHTDSSRDKAWKSIIKAMDDSMGAKWEKVKAKDGKKRLKKVLSVVAPDFVPYCLRHTYCTDLQSKGVPLKMASYLMGHSNISVTADIYTHVTDDALFETAKLVGVTKVVTLKGKGDKTA